MAYLIQTKKQWDKDARYREMALREMALQEGSPILLARWLPEMEVVRRDIEWLLEHLYSSDTTVGCRYNGMTAPLPGGEKLKIATERINWGDLGVRECEKKGDHWHIILEEAALDSYNLCRYVAEWMAVWGWPCDVRAEW